MASPKEKQQISLFTPRYCVAEGSDYWIVKTNTQGNQEYNQRFGGGSNKVGTRYQATAEANIPQQVEWQPPSRQPPGLYIIKLQTRGQVSHRK